MTRVNITRARKGRGRVNQPVNQIENSIGHRRILLEYQVQGCQLPTQLARGGVKSNAFETLPRIYFVVALASFLSSRDLFARRSPDFPNGIPARSV